MTVQESEDREGMFVAGIAKRAVTTTILGDGDPSAHERIARDGTGGQSHIK